MLVTAQCIQAELARCVPRSPRACASLDHAAFLRANLGQPLLLLQAILVRLPCAWRKLDFVEFAAHMVAEHTFWAYKVHGWNAIMRRSKRLHTGSIPRVNLFVLFPTRSCALATHATQHPQCLIVCQPVGKQRLVVHQLGDALHPCSSGITVKLGAALACTSHAHAHR